MKGYQSVELKQRTKQFAVRIVRLFRALPKTEEARVLGRQILRSGTSVAANYRAVCRARSRAEFIAKIGTVVEETDETVSWLELLAEAGIATPKQLEELLVESMSSWQSLRHRNAQPKLQREQQQALSYARLNDPMTQSINDSIPCGFSLPPCRRRL